MKLWTILKLFLNRSLLRKSLIATLFVWIVLQLPILISGYMNNIERQRAELLARQIASEKVYLSLLESVARFGDLVAARGQVLALGGQIGLLGITFCDEREELLGRFASNQCDREARQHFGKISFNNKEIEVRFNWYEQKVFADKEFYYTWAITSLLTMFIVLGGSMFTYQLIQRRLQLFSNEISNSSADSEMEVVETDLPEMKNLINSVNEMRSKIKESHKIEMDNFSLKVMGNIARQLAHDIRSPLSVLQLSLNDSGLDLDRKDLLNGVSSRIRAIADDLLLKSKEYNNLITTGDSSDEKNIRMEKVKKGEGANLIKVINQIITEKNATLNFKIKTSVPKNLIFVVGDELDFGRIISNLLNNSIEALEANREAAVEVSVRVLNKSVCLFIRDNGKGIPEEILKRIGEVGFSHGKTNGNGLGVSFAKSKLAEWGGSLQIVSKANEGTMVTVTLVGVNH